MPKKSTLQIFSLCLRNKGAASKNFGIVQALCDYEYAQIETEIVPGPNSTIHLQVRFFPFSQEARSKHQAKQARGRSAQTHTSVCNFFVE